MKPIIDSGYKLLHDGSIALSQIETNGIRIDTDYLGEAIISTDNRIKNLTLKMRNDKIFKLWRKTFGQRTNMGSREQLGSILFGVMKILCSSFTETGKPKTDISVLEGINLKFVRRFTRLAKLKDVKVKYLQSILQLSVDGYLHPVFNLHLVRTFRSQSNDPNFHNIPVRDPMLAELVRRAFIARRNHQIAETDYRGVEIASTTCYHKDPRMISYIKDDTKDLHRDEAALIYKLRKNQVTKDTRYCGKNMFVFPEFYGDWYLKCAKNLWEAINKMKLKTVKGTPLRKHLRKKGIIKLGACDPKKKPKEGTFEKHIQEIEDDFWDELFPVYREWKEDWYDDYLEKGYFDTLTGFRIEGIMSRNEVINYPAQGTAFHFLLWSLIRIQKLLKKYRMRSLLVGQIHDSIVGDVFRKELRNYLEICQQVMTLDIRKYWKWINIPLKIEAEVAPVGGNWYEKEKVIIRR